MGIEATTTERWPDGTFQALLDAAPDAIVVVTPDGRITFVNAQAERLFGWSRDELVDEGLAVLLPSAARAVHPDHLERYFADPHPRPMGAGMALAARRRDGSEFPVEISLSAVQTADGTVVSAAVRDVTDRLEAEAERTRLREEAERDRLAHRLTQAERLESLGQLAGGVAHDFNNLLAVIANYASFIAEEVERACDEPGGERWRPVRDDVQQVRSAAERATGLTHQLLAFGRREVVQPRVLDLNDVVVGIEQILRRTLGEHVDLDVRLAPHPVRTTADPGQLEQVLLNLVVNARDAMPRGGSLLVETTEVPHDGSGAVVEEPPASWARLRVRDTGTGMPPEVLAHVFEPFFTTKPKGEGSGLGLATVYGILSQAGGVGLIDSEVGRGTTFTALLPATAEAPTSEEHPAPGPEIAGGETVLVVEDEDAMREVTRRILTRNGYQVLTAATGVEAVGLADRHPEAIHLLLTDVVMPQVLGNEVAEQVADLRPGIRILFMSGYAHNVLTEQGRLPEGVHLVQKPFSEAELVHEVRTVLDGS